MHRDPVVLHKRKSFTAKDRARIFTTHKGVCGISGLKIGASDEWQIEHRIALALGGTNDDENLYPALVEPHKGKTRTDVAAIAKCKRIVLKSDPETRKPSKMKSRPFPKSGPKQKIPSRGWERKK